MPDLYEETDVAEEVDSDATPPWVDEGTEDDEMSLEGEDISGAQPLDRTDVIEPAKGVEVYIKGIPTLDVYTPRTATDWNKISLKVTLVVGEKGVDGKGKYKNKHLFPRLLVKVNREAYPDQFGTPFYAPRNGGAFGDYNMFLQKLGFPTSPAPTNDKKFRQSLEGRRLIIDITKDKRRAFDETKKKWVNTDEYENNVKYVGSPKPAAQQAVEVAAS